MGRIRGRRRRDRAEDLVYNDERAARARARAAAAWPINIIREFGSLDYTGSHGYITFP